MSLSVTQYPQPFTPAYNNQFICATSTEYTQPDFKYTVTITVNGDVVYTQGILPRPDGSMVFNARKWVENYIQHYFKSNYANNFSVATGKTANVVITIFEDYGASPVPPVVTIEYTAFDACLTDEEFYNYDAGDFVSGANNDVIFLGQTIEEVIFDNKINTNQNVWLHFTLGDILKVNIDMTMGTQQVLLRFSLFKNSPANVYDIYFLDIGSKQFNAVNNSIITVKFYNNSNAIIKTYSYTVKDICTKYTDIPVYYLNRFGNVPFFHFDKKSSDKLSKVTNKVRLAKNQLSNGAYSYNTYDREVHIVSTSSTKGGTLNTDWINESQSESLQDLFDSPIVWAYKDGLYVPITVKETTYDFKKRVNDKLFNYSIDFDYTTVKLRQRGI